MTSTRLAPPDPSVELCGQSPVTALTFGLIQSRGKQQVLISGHQNGKLIEWNISTQRPFASWQGHSDTVLSLSWTKDRLMTQGREGVVSFWSLNSAEWIIIGQVVCGALLFCNISMSLFNSEFLLAVPSEKTAYINIHHIEESKINSVSLSTESPFSVFSHSLQPTDVKHYGMCMKMCFLTRDCDEPCLIVAYESGTLALWDVLKRQILCNVKAHEESIMCLDCWSNVGTGSNTKLMKCLTGSVDKELKSWRIEDNSIVNDKAVSVTNPGFNDVAIRQDGKICATGGWDYMGRVFSLAKLKPLAVLTYHRDSVQCVTFALDNTFATGSKDGYIALWDIYKDR